MARDRTARDRGRRRGRPSEFAYVDSHGEGHLKVADAADIREAIARFDETEFEGTLARERARLRILVEAEQHHVTVPTDDIINRPTPGTEPKPEREPRAGHRGAAREGRTNARRRSPSARAR